MATPISSDHGASPVTPVDSSPVPHCAVAAGYRASSDIPCPGGFEGGGGNHNQHDGQGYGE